MTRFLQQKSVPVLSSVNVSQPFVFSSLLQPNARKSGENFSHFIHAKGIIMRCKEFFFKILAWWRANLNKFV
jgi:hypothetical protein